jgi:hypothetical protein
MFMPCFKGYKENEPAAFYAAKEKAAYPCGFTAVPL